MNYPFKRFATFPLVSKRTMTRIHDDPSMGFVIHVNLDLVNVDVVS